MTTVSLIVNDRAVHADIPPRLHLADFLREHLLLTGTHIGCEHGICGACTVEIDGEIARSCITYAVACDGSTVRTIEGFDDDALMERLRQAFSQEHALQCGYCTPGMLIAARDLLQRKPHLGRAAIRTEMSGNLCRCTGYIGVINAVARLMAEGAAVSRKPVERLGTCPAVQTKNDAATMAEAREPRTTSVAPAPISPLPVAAALKPLGSSLTPRAVIKVTVDPIRLDNGTTHVHQTFTIDQSRESVWQLIRDPTKVAGLIPGVTLTSVDNDTVRGQMAIRLGPIRATFVGQGIVERAVDEYRQVIGGRGDDRSSGSIAEGRIACALYRVEGATSAATNVDITLSYSLRGPLAQFGRLHLIREFVAQIGERFATNLDAALSNDTPGVAQTDFAPLPLLWRAMVRDLRRRVMSLFRSEP
jgi:aerobic carbon-monoxide dehydrogenase small subunit